MIEDSFSSTSVTGDDYVGGFIGYFNRSDAVNCFSIWRVALGEGHLASGIGQLTNGTQGIAEDVVLSLGFLHPYFD